MHQQIEALGSLTFREPSRPNIKFKTPLLTGISRHLCLKTPVNRVVLLCRSLEWLLAINIFCVA